MTSAIHSTLVTQRPTPQFNEGAGTSNAGKITAIALSVLGCLASFMLLPVEGAFVASAGILTLLSMLCCCNFRGGGETISRIVPIVLGSNSSLNNYRDVAPIVHRRAYSQGIVDGGYGANVPNGYVNNQPVRNVGPRVQVGHGRGGHRSASSASFPSRQVYDSAQASPAVYSRSIAAPVTGNPNAIRVPVGRGHR